MVFESFSRLAGVGAFAHAWPEFVGVLGVQLEGQFS